MKIFNKISFFLSLLVLFSFNANNAFADTAEAKVYKVTVYRLAFCETGSTISNCQNPTEIEYQGAGLTMDIASVDAGAVAGTFGNLNKLEAGKSYSHGEVILNRSFTMAGAGLSLDGEECQTGGAAGTKTDLGNGVTGLTPGTTEQVIFITNSSSLGSNVSGTTKADGTGSNAASGNIDSTHDYVRFIWAFAQPFVMGNKVPSMTIAFDVSAAIGFYAQGGLDCDGDSISSEQPVITNIFN